MDGRGYLYLPRLFLVVLASEVFGILKCGFKKGKGGNSRNKYSFFHGRQQFILSFPVHFQDLRKNKIKSSLILKFCNIC